MKMFSEDMALGVHIIVSDLLVASVAKSLGSFQGSGANVDGFCGVLVLRQTIYR